MAAPRYALYTLDEQSDEEDGSRDYNLNHSNHKLLRAGLAHFDSEVNIEDAIRNQLDPYKVKESIQMASCRVETLRLANDQEADEIDEETREKLSTEAQEDLMFKTQVALIRKGNQLKQKSNVQIKAIS